MASVQPSEEGSIRSSVSGVDRKSSGITKAAAKDLKYRSEWEDDKTPVTKKELKAWYLYDWAHSGFPSAAGVLWIPILLDVLAERHACPYMKEPQFDTGDLNWNAFDGFQNVSKTLCTYNTSMFDANGTDPLNLLAGGDYAAYSDCTTCKLDSGAIEGYGRWMERGNPEFGLNYYPSHTRKDEPTEDVDEIAIKSRMLIDDQVLKFSSVDYDTHTICAAASGVTSVSPIHNVSLYTSALPELDKETDYTAGINSGYVSVPFTTTQSSGDPLTTEDLDLKASSNPNFFASADTWSFEVDSSVTADGNPLVQAWKLKMEPEAFNLGSTLVHLGIGDADIKFTFTAVKFIHCPYRVFLFGVSVKPVSFATASVSIGVLVQAIFFFSLSAMGDFGPYRKRIMMQFGFTGAIGCMLFIVVARKPSDYQIASYLYILIATGLGTSIVMYNAYIPELTRSSPTFLEAMDDYKNKRGDYAASHGSKKKGMKSGTELLVNTYTMAMDRISETGHFYGYSGATLNVILSSIVVVMVGFHDIVSGIGVTMLFMGAWWFFFTLPALFNLRKRAGPPLPGSQNLVNFIWFSLKRSFATFQVVSHIPETKKFMLAYFLYTDGISTISQCGVLFALHEMGMDMMGFLIICTISPFFAMVGIKGAMYAQDHWGTSTKKLLQFSLIVYTGVCAWGILGFTGIIGYVYPWELYFIVLPYGGCLGIYESASRTMFCELVPPGQESEFFGIYEISDKGSSWVGPLVVAILYNAFGSVRYGFVYLFFACIFAWYILTYHVDLEKGSQDCREKGKIVRMEAVRKKFGVSKKQIQAEIKKRKKLQSSIMSASSGGSSVKSSTASSAVGGTESAVSSVERESKGKE
ncbi:hypothetical protein TrLO_g5195 [Triparma laevis f. longispina]|uniref:Autophagy-related protein n=1 Tax=Triparma laevis f. longispina TaxID=1714387 RepID=A0A9W7AC19_9STRA|nr:hypothetical protein TrLO_g5195 [Triparma laevis f. longispina]